MERIINKEQLAGHGNIEGRKLVLDILEAGMQAGDPYTKMMSALKLEDGILTVGDPAFEPIGTPRPGCAVYDLNKDVDRVFVVAAGKGMLRICKALEEVLGDYYTGGVALVKYGDKEELAKTEVLYGGHPIPDENCVKGCERILSFIDEAELTERDLVFTAIGNGIGSLLTLPGEGIPLQAVSDMVHLLQIEKGVPTAELSFVRNQVDRIKGGRLSRRLVPAKMCHILAVDCNYGNTGAPGYIGLTRANVWLHTLPDVSTKEWAAGVLMKWGAWDLVDPSIRAFLGNPEAGEETLRAEEFETWDCYIFGVMPDSQAPVPEAMKKAAELGYTPHMLSRAHELEAGVMGKFYAQMGAGVANFGEPFEAPCAIFFTGEMVVTVGDSDGVGGRNQECALAAATAMGGNEHVVIGSVDTDGTDGPGGEFNADATAQGCVNLTGGLVDGFTVGEAKEKGVDVATALKTHATSDALWRLDSGIWATQNISVQDLGVILVMPKE